MALLDLQMLEAPEHEGDPDSTVSLLACEVEDSALSLLLC
ncbi:SapB/AmfS family lanthipeptide [Streptomyces sp. NPDC053542]